MKVYYDPQLKKLARLHRNNMTQAEAILWKRLKGNQLMGYDFHRQKPIDHFIADFYCYALRLIIEVDRYSHQFEEVAIKDRIKEEKLTNLGFTILRFQDQEITNNLTGALQVIENYILDFQEKHPTPP